MTAAPCPATETLCGWVEGRLEEGDRADLEVHLDTCAACRRAVAEVGRVMGGAPAETPDERRAPGPSKAPPGSLPPSGAPRIGRYEVRREIGVGGMGVVYEGFDPSLGRRVALKLIRPDRGEVARAAVAERLAAEARALAKISHPNVLTVFDVGVDGDSVFLATEFVEGVTMDAGWPHRARGWRDRVEAYLQAAQGLGAIHAAGLTHRDIKPSNILLGDDGRVRIADFGLATSLGERSAPAGTPAYMAPEQLTGDAGPRADQYALAMCMVEAVLGTRPSLGATAADLEAKARGVWAKDTPPTPLWEVFARALSPMADERFGDVAALIAAVESAIAPASPPSRRAAPPSRRAAAPGGRTAYAALAVALVATGAAGLSLLGRGAPSAPAVSAPALGDSGRASEADRYPAADVSTLPAAVAEAPSASAAPGAAGASTASAPSAPHPPSAPQAGGAPPAPAGAQPAGAEPAELDPSDPLIGLKRTVRVQELIQDATKALHARDGKRCLQKLDELVRFESSAAAGTNLTRAMCEMVSGQCQAGVNRIKNDKSLSNRDLIADTYRSSYCPASSLSAPKDKIKSVWLQAAVPPATAAKCSGHEGDLQKALQAAGKDVDTTAVAGAWSAIAVCWINADNCARAGEIVGRGVAEDQRAEYVDRWLKSTHPKCAKN